MMGFDNKFKTVDLGEDKIKLFTNKAIGNKYYAIISEEELTAMRDRLIEWVRQTKDLNSLDQRKQ